MGAGNPPAGGIYGPGGVVPVDDGVAGAVQDVAGTGGLFGIACPGLGDCLAGGLVTPDGETTLSGVLLPIGGG